MKQAYQVNFEGFEFYIDEDARGVFFEFIEKSEKKFQDDPTEKEEWEVFKKTLLEKLKTRIKDQRKVLNIEELEDIIASYGMHANDAYQQGRSTGYGNRAKDYFRDMDSSVIAGVCSGMARFLSTDVTWIRVLFIILGIFTFPLGEIIYAVIWVVAPSNKILVQGKKHETRYAYKDKYVRNTNIDNAFTTLFKGIGNLIQAILKSAAGLVGIVLIFIGIFMLLGFFNIWPWHFIPNFDHHWWHYEWSGAFDDINHDKLLLLLFVVFLIAIPILSLIYNLIKTIFGIKSKNSILKYLILMLWFLCLVATIGIWFSKDDFGNTTTETQRLQLKKTNSPALYVNTSNNNMAYYNEVSNDKKFLNYRFIERRGEKYLYGKPEIEIVRSDDFDKFEIAITRTAKISRKNDPHYKLQSIEYFWQQNDSLLVLDKYFYTNALHWWQSPGVKIEIVVPKFTNVLFTGPFENQRRFNSP